MISLSLYTKPLNAGSQPVSTYITTCDKCQTFKASDPRVYSHIEMRSAARFCMTRDLNTCNTEKGEREHCLYFTVRSIFPSESGIIDLIKLDYS